MENLKSVPVGIDLGSEKIVIAVFKDFKIDIICNQLSYRESSNLVSYTNEERLFGDIAKMKVEMNLNLVKKFFEFICTWS